MICHHPANSVKALKEATRNVGQCPTWWPPCQI